MTTYGWTLISVFLVIGLFCVAVWKYDRKYILPVVLFNLSIVMIEGLVGKSEFLVSGPLFPPRFVLVPVFLIILLFIFVRSEMGRSLQNRLPVWFLIAFQTFRVLPEYMLHLSYGEGLAPVQMTWQGWNFDILTAISAPIFAWLVYRNGKLNLYGGIFSFIGVGLLLNIVAISLLSAPTPLRVFMNEPANVFVGTFPYIYLPGIHVFYAALMHVLLIRKIFAKNFF